MQIGIKNGVNIAARTILWANWVMIPSKIMLSTIKLNRLISETTGITAAISDDIIPVSSERIASASGNVTESNRSSDQSMYWVQVFGRSMMVLP